MEVVPGPAFPTGGLILGRSRARSAYQTGRGSIIVRSRHVIEENRGDRRSIVLTEIPFQQGKNALVEKIADAAKDKRIEGVSDIRDESNRLGVRIVRSEEHTSELQSLMRISYAVFCLKKKKHIYQETKPKNTHKYNQI